MNASSSPELCLTILQCYEWQNVIPKCWSTENMSLSSEMTQTNGKVILLGPTVTKHVQKIFRKVFTKDN